MHFQQDLKTGQWVYKHSDLRPWDPRNDLYQYENEYKILTRTQHPTPMIRTASIISVEPQQVTEYIQLCASLELPFYSKIIEYRSSAKASKRKLATKQISSDADVNDSSTDEFHSDSSQEGKKEKTISNSR